MEKYTSYRFGAGRYLQEPDILAHSGGEICRYGKKVYVIGGPKALRLTWDTLEKSFQSAGLDWVSEEYSGFPSYAKLDALRPKIRENGCDVLAGVGGGRIMDLVKAAGADLGLPVVLIPTSAATCASFSPLSVMYTDEGRCVGYWHFEYEVNSVIVDELIMAAQPPRLLAAGIMDAMAKCIEISNGKPAITLQTDTIDKYSAYSLAKEVYHILEGWGKNAYQDVEQGKLTTTVHNVIFCVIALTGLVSSLMRAKGQTALAHRMYEAIRTYYFKESMHYLHGEIVATGLIAQLRFNNDTGAIKGLKEYMKSMDMPMDLQALGLEHREEVLDTLFKNISNSVSVEDTPQAHERLLAALREIY